MPSFVPRNEPTHKKEQLLNCSENLRLAIYHNKPVDSIKKLADRYRNANLSLIKAKLHHSKQLQYQDIKSQLNIKSLFKERSVWEQITLEEVIEDFKKYQKRGLG